MFVVLGFVYVYSGTFNFRERSFVGPDRGEYDFTGRSDSSLPELLGYANVWRMACAAGDHERTFHA